MYATLIGGISDVLLDRLIALRDLDASHCKVKADLLCST